MREVNFIEDKGRFGITFMSDDKAEANTVMNAIQRFISKNSSNEKKENIDFSVCPIGEYKGTIWILINTISLKKYLSDYNLPEGYKIKIIEELKKRGEYIDDSNIEELKKQIKEISKGEQYTLLSDEDLEKISLLESELASICKYSETAKHILQGRKFSNSRELENKITQGRRLSELTLEGLKKLQKVTMLERYKLDIQKEIDKRIENKSFEETLEEDNGIISFGEDEDDSNYRVDDENEEDPLSVDTDNINNWDFDADGDKVDSEGNKMLFDY